MFIYPFTNYTKNYKKVQKLQTTKKRVLENIKITGCWAFRQPERLWVSMSNTWTVPQGLGTTFICLHPHAGLHLPLPQPLQRGPGELGWTGGDEGLRCGHSPGCQAVPTQTRVTAGCPCWSLSSYAWVIICSSAFNKIWRRTKFSLGSWRVGLVPPSPCSDSSPVTARRAWQGLCHQGLVAGPAQWGYRKSCTL